MYIASDGNQEVVMGRTVDIDKLFELREYFNVYGKQSRFVRDIEWAYRELEEADGDIRKVILKYGDAVKRNALQKYDYLHPKPDVDG